MSEACLRARNLNNTWGKFDNVEASFGNIAEIILATQGATHAQNVSGAFWDAFWQNFWPTQA